MPYTILCPHCGKPLTAHESPAAVLVRCAACGQPLTVPAVAVAVPATEPFTLPDREIEDRPRRRRREPAGSNPMQWIVVGAAVIVLVAAGIFIYGEIQSRYDQHRLQELENQHIDLVCGMLDRQIAIGASNSPYDDPQYKAIFDKDYYVVQEHTKIRKRHPSWTIKVLAVGP